MRCQGYLLKIDLGMRLVITIHKLHWTLAVNRNDTLVTLSRATEAISKVISIKSIVTDI